jgi:hypothetical protein
MLPSNGNSAGPVVRYPLPPVSDLPTIHWVGSGLDKWPFPIPSWYHDLVPIPGNRTQLTLYIGTPGDKWAVTVQASSIDQAWLKARWPGLFEPEPFPRR